LNEDEAYTPVDGHQGNREDKENHHVEARRHLWFAGGFTAAIMLEDCGNEGLSKILALGESFIPG